MHTVGEGGGGSALPTMPTLGDGERAGNAPGTRSTMVDELQRDMLPSTVARRGAPSMSSGYVGGGRVAAAAGRWYLAAVRTGAEQRRQTSNRLLSRCPVPMECASYA